LLSLFSSVFTGMLTWQSGLKTTDKHQVDT
jgi:hypothetical protein